MEKWSLLRKSHGRNKSVRVKVEGYTVLDCRIKSMNTPVNWKFSLLGECMEEDQGSSVSVKCATGESKSQGGNTSRGLSRERTNV